MEILIFVFALIFSVVLFYLVRYWLKPDFLIVSMGKDFLIVKMIKPKSLLQLRRKYGLGEDGFDPGNTWWLKMDFAKEIPEQGIYHISSDSLYYYENDFNFDFPHPSVVAQVFLEYKKRAGEKLFERFRNCPHEVEDGLITFNSCPDGLNIDQRYYRANRQAEADEEYYVANLNNPL